MIVISGDFVKKPSDTIYSKDVYFHKWDGGDAYNLILNTNSKDTVPGTLYWAKSMKKPSCEYETKAVNSKETRFRRPTVIDCSLKGRAKSPYQFER